MSRPAPKKLQKKRASPKAVDLETKPSKWFVNRLLSQARDFSSNPPSSVPQKHVFQRSHGVTNEIKQLFNFRRHKTQTTAPNTTSALPTDQSSDRASTTTTESNEPLSDTMSPSSMSSAARSRKNPIRRFLGIFIHSKRDSAVCLSDSDPASQTDAESEQGEFDEEFEAEEDTYSDDGEPDEDDPDDRRNFKAIRTISRKAIEDFVLKLMHPNEELDSLTCRVTLRKEGSFHHAVFLQIELGGVLKEEFVLKIPAHGTPEHWKDGDAFMLRNEAVLMQHIRHHTDCPVPDVVAFDNTVSNPIGAPYILMKKMSGISALDMWHGQPYKTLKIGQEYLDADDPSSATEEKRIRFLHSLAHAMSHLQKLEFDKVGLPVFDDAEDEKPSSYGPMWRWHSKTVMQELAPIGPFDSSEDYFRAGLTWGYSRFLNCGLRSSGGALFICGVRKILDMVFSSPPFTPPRATSTSDTTEITANETKASAEESFVLCHDDLDLQNVLVDDEGNVTGIIDWDGCMAVPRCIGYSSLPTFLRRDWLPDHNIARTPHMTWSLNRYREIYAKAIEEACKASGPLTKSLPTDAMFTRKSAMYQAIFAVLFEPADIRDVVGKLLEEIPDFRRVDLTQLCVRLGREWPAAEKVLEEKIAELLRPE